ncbi:MAG TPA: gamma-glutamyltransferase [Gammaproteobacteria bacterium]|nr:gamma-glutamyltransferase [Gammaproteobacteria bacterium]
MELQILGALRQERLLLVLSQMKDRNPILFFSLLLCLSNNTLFAQTTLDYDNRIHPELAQDYMVVSQNHHSTDAGYQILKQGGNAIDAAVAVGFALAVTLPRAGNLGGGGFMLIYSADSQEVSAIDYRSAAPVAATSEMYLTESGVVRFGHLVNAVPGSVAGLIKAHKEHGKLSLKEVLRPAIQLARKGFPVSYDLNYVLDWGKDSMLANNASKKKFYNPKDKPLPVASILKQPKLARTLNIIANKGDQAFYEGEIADWIVEDSLANGGLITKGDLANYSAKDRVPIESFYRGYKIVSMPPAASGGIVLLQILNILENFDLTKYGHNSASSIHLLSEAMLRAYSDRMKYHGDPDYFNVPIDGLLDKHYAKERAKSINLKAKTPSEDIFPGKIPFIDESPDTTHFSVIDSDGNAVSNTYTLGSSFGSGVTVPEGGFLLNNQMRNFSHLYGKSDELSLSTSSANKLEPGKRMISTQTPTLVFNPEGNLMMILGSPGGGRIPNIIAQVISNVIDHKLGFAEAVMAPRINQRVGKNLELESGFSPDTIELLKVIGHQPKPSTTMGSVQAIFLSQGYIHGVSDTRRPGAKAKGN